ncbi:hypothetical protein [Apilactobacillus micheneri]|uniref:hypothetical protein n=1 Tax=Apilactobacillus micheneri TaxID=1899430 RepID=UPI00112720FE|nr:hypothetical protein [Apilactobacillus micheneri]TPR40435.1 hypothetical protein DY119_01725 [Apilactobacillus micheneri]
MNTYEIALRLTEDYFAAEDMKTLLEQNEGKTSLDLWNEVYASFFANVVKTIQNNPMQKKNNNGGATLYGF